MQKKKAQDNLNPQSKLIIKQRSKNVLSDTKRFQYIGKYLTRFLNK